MALEMYPPERKAEFLLSNAMDDLDYARAQEEVRKLGLDPDTIAHRGLEGATLGTSSYATLEARRNLSDEEELARLDGLLNAVEVGEASMLPPDLRGNVDLAERDWPILGGAATSGATHLITGDVRHFGRYLGERQLRVLILSPAQYLKSRT